MNNKEYKYIYNKTWLKLIGDNCFKSYNRQETLEKYLKLLKQEEFDTYVFNCSDWVGLKSFEKDYENKVILTGDLQDGSKYLPDKEGFVCVFQNFGEYLLNYYEEAIKTLETINMIDRQCLLFGKKIIVLLNCNSNLLNDKLWEMDNPPLQSVNWLNDDCFYC